MALKVIVYFVTAPKYNRSFGWAHRRRAPRLFSPRLPDSPALRLHPYRAPIGSNSATWMGCAKPICVIIM